NYHGSNQGWGRWEINPHRLGNGGVLQDYLSLYRGNVTPNGDTPSGKYGNLPGSFPPDVDPALSGALAFPTPDHFGPPISPPGTPARGSANVDYDGSRLIPPLPPPPGPNATAPNPAPFSTFQPQLPQGVTSAFAAFPGNYRNGDVFERYAHPSLYNP